mmetsp:Transcript_60491/g.179820  ORF Transcript_60491/g.179820 Transcript_60491/m.179820 type:complete len:212 (+) Transcript_60491:219-854(+)
MACPYPNICRGCRAAGGACRVARSRSPRPRSATCPCSSSSVRLPDAIARRRLQRRPAAISSHFTDPHPGPSAYVQFPHASLPAREYRPCTCQPPHVSCARADQNRPGGAHARRGRAVEGGQARSVLADEGDRHLRLLLRQPKLEQLGRVSPHLRQRHECGARPQQVGARVHQKVEGRQGDAVECGQHAAPTGLRARGGRLRSVWEGWKVGR